MIEAVNQLSLALKQDPNRFTSIEKFHSYLALALEATGRPAEAMAEYRKTIEIAPKNAEAHYRLGILLANEHDIPEAIEQMQQAAALMPAAAPAENVLAAALVADGQMAEAVNHFQKAIALGRNRNACCATGESGPHAQPTGARMRPRSTDFAAPCSSIRSNRKPCPACTWTLATALTTPAQWRRSIAIGRKSGRFDAGP